MSDRDGLRRRAEVLQRVADQLSAQLRVERWSNSELRKVLGEPVERRGIEEERLAARRFLTFASVAVLTAALVALLVSRPWRGADVVSVEVPGLGLSSACPALGGTIVPFAIVGASDLDAGLAESAQGSDFSGPAGARGDLSLGLDEIFGRPASRVHLTTGAPRRHRATLGVGVYELFGPSPTHGGRDVP